MTRYRSRLRGVLMVAALFSAILRAEPVAALNAHLVSAVVGQSTASISDISFDPAVNFVDVSFQDGVPGVNPNARVLAASVDSASGILLTSGITVAKLVPNRGRAVSQLEQRMFFGAGGTTPVVVGATLVLIGSGVGGYIELDGSLQVGPCIVGVRRYFGFANPPAVSTSGCNNTAAVSWNTTASAGLLRITGTYTNKPSAVDVGALVSGDFGGSSSDIPDGQFTSAGSLSIETQGAAATFHSPTFLTLPEPGFALISGVLGLAFLGRSRRPRYP